MIGAWARVVGRSDVGTFAVRYWFVIRPFWGWGCARAESFVRVPAGWVRSDGSFLADRSLSNTLTNAALAHHRGIR